MLLQSIKLLLSLEDLNQLEDSPFEDIKLPEDLRLTEVKVTTPGKGLDLLLDLSVLLLILLVELDAVVEHLYQLVRVTVPDRHLQGFLVVGVIVFGVFFFVAVEDLFLLWKASFEDIVFAISDHLVSDLLEQVGHSSSPRVVSGDRMDHFNRIHQRRQGLNNCLRSPLIQRFNELLKYTQILNIILCLIQLIRQVNLFHLVLRKQVGHVLLSGSSPLGHIRRLLLLQELFDKLEVVALELLRQGSDVVKSLLPVFKLCSRTWTG